MHWFEHRLPLEPEWEAVLPSIKDLAAKLLKLWEEQKPRVERYGHEASLEQAFIQPVLQLLAGSSSTRRSSRTGHRITLSSPMMRRWIEHSMLAIRTLIFGRTRR